MTVQEEDTAATTTECCSSEEVYGSGITDALSRYTLSVVLSFLNEIDGTCALSTNTRWYRRVLPMFLLPSSLVVVPSSTNTNPQASRRRPRHRFVVVPVQDSKVLLERYNTRRLYRRILYRQTHNKSPHLTINNNNDNNNSNNGLLSMTTEQLADHEWKQSMKTSSRFPNNSCWPAHLDLLRFEMASKQIGTTIVASYPRSGNTLLRHLLERVTNVITGSDTRPDRTLSRSLAMEHNLVGEGLVTTPIVKTHFPERRGCVPFDASRIIVLVRNPFDAMDSYWNMCCTNTHTRRVDDCIYDLYRDKWEGLIRNEIRVWCDFYQYYLNDEGSAVGDVPMLVVRYEDLILHTEREMMRLLKFVSNPNVDDTTIPLNPFWSMRLRHGLGLASSNDNNETDSLVDTTNIGSYRNTHRRHHQSNNNNNDNNDDGHGKKLLLIGSSLRKNRYSNELLNYIHNVATDRYNNNNEEGGDVLDSIVNEREQNKNENTTMSLLQRFGYDVHRQQFPTNFLLDDAPPIVSVATQHSSKQSFVRVNVGSEIRSTTDPYGRAMTTWRRHETENDARPFPITPPFQK